MTSVKMAGTESCDKGPNFRDARQQELGRYSGLGWRHCQQVRVLAVGQRYHSRPGALSSAKGGWGNGWGKPLGLLRSEPRDCELSLCASQLLTFVFASTMIAM